MGYGCQDNGRMSDPRYGHTDELTHAYPRESRRGRRTREDDTEHGYSARMRDDERARDRAARARTVRVATAVATILTSAFAAILALQIVFALLDANEANSLVMVVSDLAYTLAWFFHDLFTPDNSMLRIFLNYGLAALFWLGIGQGISVLLRSLR